MPVVPERRRGAGRLSVKCNERLANALHRDCGIWLDLAQKRDSDSEFKQVMLETNRR
jgi:hypothetical protein